MEVIIRKTEEDASQLAADLIAGALVANPGLVLGLATGRTMEGLYAKLVRKHTAGTLDFSRAVTFNLDEYIGLAPENPNSYRSYMNAHFFNQINIPIENTHLPNGAAADLDRECEAYEERIAASGGIDLQLLGIGSTGHIGFNEPLSALRSRTRCKALTPGTIVQNSALFDNPADMPKRAITMGVGTILDSRRCIMLVTGEAKADIVSKAVEGPITSMISASALQLHPKCTVVCDEGAASKLENQGYYNWIFQNEPEWAPYR